MRYRGISHPIFEKTVALSSFKLLTHQNNFIENSILLPYLKIIHDDGTQK